MSDENEIKEEIILKEILEECYKIYDKSQGNPVFIPPPGSEKFYEMLVAKERLARNPMGDGYVFPEMLDSLFKTDRPGRGHYTREDVISVPMEEYQDDEGPLVIYDDGAELQKDGQRVVLMDGTVMTVFNYKCMVLKRNRKHNRWWRRAGRWLKRKLLRS